MVSRGWVEYIRKGISRRIIINFYRIAVVIVVDCTSFCAILGTAIILNFYRIAVAIVVDCTSFCAILGTAFLCFGISSWYSMSAIVAVFNLAQIIGKHFRDRSAGYAIHTPTYQWRNKNVWTRLNALVLSFSACCLYTLLDLTTVTLMQRVLIITGVQNLSLTTEDILLLISCWRLLRSLLEDLGIPYNVFGAYGRQSPDWEVDMLGISERRPLFPFGYNKSCAFRPANQRYKTSKSSSYQLPAATLRASKLHRKRAVSPKLKQS